MAGLPPAYIARQLGHTSAEQLYKTYSHWIDGADRRVQRERLAAALISPEFPRVGAELCFAIKRRIVEECAAKRPPNWPITAYGITFTR